MRWWWALSERLPQSISLATVAALFEARLLRFRVELGSKIHLCHPTVTNCCRNGDTKLGILTLSLHSSVLEIFVACVISVFINVWIQLVLSVEIRGTELIRRIIKNMASSTSTTLTKAAGIWLEAFLSQDYCSMKYPIGILIGRGSGPFQLPGTRLFRRMWIIGSIWIHDGHTATKRCTCLPSSVISPCVWVCALLIWQCLCLVSITSVAGQR